MKTYSCTRMVNDKGDRKWVVTALNFENGRFGLTMAETTIAHVVNAQFEQFARENYQQVAVVPL